MSIVPRPSGWLVQFLVFWVAWLISTRPGLRAEEPSIDTRPLPVKTVPAFPNMQWPEWNVETEKGQIEALRPILVTHANDQSGRLFVPTQYGSIYLVSLATGTPAATLFLNLREKVSYNESAKEEGLLGLAFHPRFASNGTFYLYYTNRSEPHQNVISSFQLDPSDGNRAAPASEKVLMVIDKPYWNHDGGTICFGPDGFLYIAVGDGGAGHDPHGNGQNKNTLLGKILRIDVDREGVNTPYAIPEDNPFAGMSDVRPEIWAYGLRNIWRMAFDPVTNQLWGADVGQDVWEEIDIISRGANYGWNLREGKHPLGDQASEPRPEFTDPIWEYHHDIGKSIIGGMVYRGTAIPELQGAYLYADYVSMKVWGLFYDQERKQVTANRELVLPAPMPVVSFGEDEHREVFLMTESPDGKGIVRLLRDE